jgi:periplasmic protein TonB
MELIKKNIDDPVNLRVTDKTIHQQKIIKIWNQTDLINELLNIKKTKKVRGHQTAKLFFNIGLFFSMVFVTLLFEWRTYDTGALVKLTSSSELFDELLEIPPTEQPPPPPPKVIKQPNIIEVQEIDDIKEEIKVDFDTDISADDVVEPILDAKMDKPVEERADEIFAIVENQPEPKMGMSAFLEYIYKNINYPRGAVRTRVQGKVFVQFVVNADGSLTDFEVIRGIGMGCDEEAVRVLKNAEPWTPGKQRGRPVRVRMVIPINFVIVDR